MSAVLLSVPPAPLNEDVRRHVVAAGFAVIDHRTGAAPAVDFAPVAVAVLVVGESPGAAAAQTRRWRAELGERHVPVLWLCPPGHAATGLDAGADAALPRPVEPAVLAAQLRALARSQSMAARSAVRANEARLLGEQLQKALAQLDREHDLTRRVRIALSAKPLPDVGAVRFYAVHRPRARSGAEFADARRIDETRAGFVVGDAPGLLGLFVQQFAGTTTVDPGEALTAMNRALLGLGADDLPPVSLLAGTIDTYTGAVSLARAGLPAAVHVPASGEPRVLHTPGPFLGTADTTYPTTGTTLVSGDRLLIGTDGTRPDGDPAPVGSDHILTAAARHRALSGREFADAVGRDLLQQVRHPDDFTLLCVEMA
jgi:hypothetical protein